VPANAAKRSYQGRLPFRCAMWEERVCAVGGVREMAVMTFVVQCGDVILGTFEISSTRPFLIHYC
jgi:hypothetical protein